MEKTDQEPTRRAAVYRLYDKDDVLLYIGSAYDPEHRCKAHRNLPWWPQVARRTEEWHTNRGRAYNAEMAAIAVEGSKYNRMGTPTYRAPITEATLRRDADNRARARADREGWNIRHETIARMRAEGASFDEAWDAGEAARFAHLEETGLFPAYMERRRARRENAKSSS